MQDGYSELRNAIEAKQRQISELEEKAAGVREWNRHNMSMSGIDVYSYCSLHGDNDVTLTLTNQFDESHQTLSSIIIRDDLSVLYPHVVLPGHA